MIDRILYYLWAGERAFAREKRLGTIVICSNCKAEFRKGTNFCARCGNRNLLRVREFEKLEDRRDKEINREIAEKRRRNAIRKRINQLKTATPCSGCDAYFESGASFCTICGRDISGHVLSDETIFDIVRKEFPKEIRSMEGSKGSRNTRHKRRRA